MNNYANNQARTNTADIQNDVQQVIGEPIRVYPFKVVSGFNYLSNRGLSDIGTNPGNTYPDIEQGTITNIPYGAYTDLSLIYSGNRPLIAYWFGVMNATMNADGTIMETINATQDKNGNWVPNMFSNPLTAKSLDNTKVGLESFGDMEQQNPWKNVGVIDFSYAPNHTYTHQLDNVECGVYEMVYNYSCFSNEWCPSFQEINEFIYYIIDIRYPCPLALRITGVTPHYRPDGAFQWADIQFQSINQYFNTSSYSILTYVKFGAPNDAYAFPQEIIENGEIKTILNPNFILNSQAGVDSVCIKNNSLVAHLGTLIYGHPYVAFQENNGVLTRTNQPDRYLLPLSFEAPINDNIVTKHSLVHSSYCLAMNMVIVSEQLWGSWKQTKEIYNPIQNFTYQGGLAFAGTPDGKSNDALFNAISNILDTSDSELVNETWQNVSPNQSGYYSWGSCNLQTVMFSNKKNWSLDTLQTQTWQPIGSSETGTGFYVYGTNGVSIGTWDFRMTKLCCWCEDNLWQEFIGDPQYFNNVSLTVADIFSAGYTPNTQQTSEIQFLTGLSNGTIGGGSFILPNVAFVLNSMSMKNVHMLEINYRDGIVYTNTNRGQGGFLNMIANWMSGIADKITGYTPGVAKFFMNTASRTYNMFIPSSLLPLFQAYLDPNGDNYNAVPLDIFNNSYDNNTAVGQLQYMSGLQFSLTDSYIANSNQIGTNTYTTQYWGKITPPSSPDFLGVKEVMESGVVSSNQAQGTFNTSFNSFCFFNQPTANLNGYSYIIDEINVKELGQSNLHITYLKRANGKLNTVGEEWVANNAKVMKNNSYIDNDFDYYVYDKYNTTFASNVSPYVAIQYAPLPDIVSTNNVPKYTLPNGATRGTYGLLSTSSIQGVSFSTNSQHWNNNLKSNYGGNFAGNLNDKSQYQNYLVANYAIGKQNIHNWTCPIGKWFTMGPNSLEWGLGSSWNVGNSCYWDWQNAPLSSLDNLGYVNICQQASQTLNNGYLTGTELISNCLLTNFSIIGNQDGPPYTGQCCSMTDTVYYETIHLVFNIEFMIAQALNQWQYKANTAYKNYYCLVPASMTQDQINQIPIPTDLPKDSSFILIYDGKNTHILSYGTNAPVKNWNLYGYLQNSFPSSPVLTNPDPAYPNDPYGPSSINGIGLFSTTTVLNGGGCVNMICVEQPGLNQASPWNEVNFTDYGGNGYDSAATVGGSSAYQIQLWGVGSNNAFPTSPTSIYGGKTFNLVMIVLE